MALVSCKYCKAKISDRALYCPKCGKSTIGGELNIFNAYLTLWIRAFDYKGFSGRKEYWLGLLSGWIINALLITILNFNPDNSFIFGLYLFHVVGAFIPYVALLVRRFRDTATKPTGAIYILVPIIGQMYVSIVCSQKSRR